MSRVYEALQQCAPELVEGGFRAASSAVPQPEAQDRAEVHFGATPVNPTRLHTFPVLQVPGTFVSEQFRYLSARLHQVRETRQLRTVVVTSSVAEEGKSFISANLAISLGRGGRNKILLLEADLRRPSQCNAFGLPPPLGLSDWWQAPESSASSFIYLLNGANCFLLPAGSPTDRPLETITSKRFSDLLCEMSAVFDWVVIDTPPMLPMADAGVISHLSDGTLLVVRRDTTPKSGFAQALERLDPGKSLGVIMNDFEAVNHYGYERYYGDAAKH